MSKYISSNEFMDKFSKVCTLNNKQNLKSTDILKEYGNVKVNYFNTGSGINYSCFIASFYEDTIIEGICNKNSSFLRFNTGNNIFLQEMKKSSKLNLDSNICWNGEDQKGYKAKTLYERKKQTVIHTIHLDNDLFNDLIPNNKSKLIFKNDDIILNYNNHINTEQKLILNDLIKSTAIQGKLKEIYLESKILELVYTTISATNSQSKEDTIYLSDQDLILLHKAKDILLSDLSNPPSLKELSHKVATNEFKLKKGFKKLFGNTVYGLLQEHRLQEAKLLLERNDINVSEACEMVGYTSLAHFSKIFKERFGVLASEIMRNRKYY